jgi:hypothetical protein
MRVRSPVRLTLLAVPIAFMTVFLLVPLGLTIVVSFWQRAGLRVRPAFTLLLSRFLPGRAADRSRTQPSRIGRGNSGKPVPRISHRLFLAYKTRPSATRMVLLLLTVPFLINYIIRTFAWTYLLNYLALPNVICVGGSWMLRPQAIAAHDWEAVTAASKQAASLKQD